MFEVSKAKRLTLINYVVEEMIDVVWCHTLKDCVHNIKCKTYSDIKSNQVLEWAGTVDTICCRVMACSYSYQVKVVTIGCQVSVNELWCMKLIQKEIRYMYIRTTWIKFVNFIITLEDISGSVAIHCLHFLSENPTPSLKPPMYQLAGVSPQKQLLNEELWSHPLISRNNLHPTVHTVYITQQNTSASV